jgi:hypothetical protein
MVTQVAKDGDPRLGHGETDNRGLAVTGEFAGGFCHRRPEQVGGEFAGAVVVAEAEDFFFFF